MTGDEPQGTMGRVQTAGDRCLLPAFLCAHIEERRLGTRQYNNDNDIDSKIFFQNFIITK